MVRAEDRFHADKCVYCGGRGRLYKLARLSYPNKQLRLGRVNQSIPFAVGKDRCVDCDGSGYKILAEISED